MKNLNFSPQNGIFTHSGMIKSQESAFKKVVLLLILALGGGVVKLLSSPICNIQPQCDPNYYVFNANGASTPISQTNIPIDANNIVICVENTSLTINRNQSFTNVTFIFKSSGKLFLDNFLNPVGSRSCIFNSCCLMGDQNNDWPGILADGEWRVEFNDCYLTQAQQAFRLQQSINGN